MSVTGVVATDSLRLGGAGRTAVASRPVGARADGERRVDAGERELVLRAREGSVEAFGALVERYEGRVMSLLRFRLRPEVEAEDVAQDVFLRAWTRLDGFDADRALGPWLMTIAARTAVAHNRSARSRRSLLERAAAVLGIDEEGDEPDSGVAGDRRVWEVARGCLSDETVTALWLRYGEDMSMREIGAALGRSEIHVRVMLSRARKRLGERMGAHRHGGANARNEEEEGGGEAV